MERNINGVCARCVYYVDDNLNINNGECHRFPPTIVFNGHGNTRSESYFPKVEPNNFCGEFRDVETKD